MQDPQIRERDTHWAARRNALIEELTPVLRAQCPEATWVQLGARVVAEVDVRMLYERFGHEP